MTAEQMAEEKWIEWCTNDADDRFAFGAHSGIKAYKSALRKAIEEIAKPYPVGPTGIPIGGPTFYEILNLIDTVTPE